MKKFLLIFILFVISLAAAKAQLPEYGIGVRGGLDWSFMRFDPNVSQNNLPMSFHVGAQFRLIAERYFGIKFELNYAQRGFKDIEGLRRLDYVELPIMAHFTFGKKLFRFFIDLGPSISCMVNENNIDGSELPQHSLPIKNRFDYGLVGGIGFEFNTKYGIYTLDGRYNFGLGNIFANTATDNFKLSSNQNITVSLAYLFPIRP